MVYENASETEKSIIIECDCKCMNIELSKYKDEDTASLFIKEDVFNARQFGFFGFLRMWLLRVLVDKGLFNYELILTPKDMKELKDALEKINQ